MPDPAEPPRTEPKLKLDELGETFDAFQILRKDDAAAADEVLTSIGANDKVDRRILLELSSKRPLGHPDRFPEAHALAVRALEVLDRNGSRAIKVNAIGPLDPVASYFVQIVAKFIIRSYTASVIDSMLRLYSRREANALIGDPARPMLTRARIHAARLQPGLKRNPLGIPTFLLGGAVVSGAVSLLTGAVSALDNWVIAAVVAVIALLISLSASWIVLRGAAIARRRIRLTMDKPLDALWETIGRAGDPPRDQSKTFVLYSVILMAAGWFIVPVIALTTVFQNVG